MDEARRDAGRFADDVHAHPPLRHLLQQHADLQFRQPRADAAVDAVAERQVAAGIGAVDADRIGILAEYAAVAVRCDGRG